MPLECPKRRECKHFAPSACHPQVSRVALWWLFIAPDGCVLAVHQQAAGRAGRLSPPSQSLPSLPGSFHNRGSASRIRNAHFLGATSGAGACVQGMTSRVQTPHSKTTVLEAQVCAKFPLKNQSGPLDLVCAANFKFFVKMATLTLFLEDLLCAGYLTHLYAILQHEDRAARWQHVAPEPFPTHPHTALPQGSVETKEDQSPPPSVNQGR